ncbi:MAG: heparinase II/III family protein [Planctomycetes bacterium]|nr:heparinase II/III family protein [Planctomycetota bacterium]
MSESRYTRGVICLLCAALLLGSCLAEEKAGSDVLLKRLIEQMTALVKTGEKPKVWVDVLGKKTEVTVSAADAKSMTVQVQGNPFPLNWEKIGLDDLASIAKCSANGNGVRLLLAGELSLAAGLNDQGSDLLAKALEADASLSDQVKAAAAKLPAQAAPVAPKPVAVKTDKPPESAGANTGMTTTSVPKREAGKSRTERPRVLFDATRLAAVKARATNADGKRFLSFLASNGKEETTMEFALAYLMTGDAKWSTEAIARIDKGCIGRGVITDLNSSFPALAETAEVYDWCYDKLADDQKKKWCEWMAKEFEAMKKEYLEGYHNYGIKAAWSFALAGYALRGDDPASEAMLQDAYEKRWRTLILPACKAGLAGGAWAEGEGYGSTTGDSLLELAEAARCADGKDLVSEAPEFFAGRLAFEMFLDMPGVQNGGRRLWINGDMNRIRNWDGPLQQRLELQEMLKGTDLAAFAQDYAELPAAPCRQYNSCNWLDVLWRDRSLPKKPLATFKLSHLAVGRGTVLMRSDWTEEATHAGFVAGPLLSYHAHADAGSFSIWKHGELVTPAGDYRGTLEKWPLDAYSRTVASNSLLIYDPAEKMRTRNRDALNDGGQLGYEGIEGKMTGAKIVAYDARRAYTYVCADLTEAYAKSKVSCVRRQIVFLRPDTVVIADRVSSTNPAFQKVWQCYLSGTAKAEGKVFHTDNGKGKLRADALLPADATVTLLGGQDKAIDVFGQKVAQPAGNGDNGPAWRAEVRPGAARGDDAFLVVLHAYDAAEPAAPTLKAEGNALKLSIPGVCDVVLNADGSPGGSVNGKALATSVVPQEE